MHRVRGCMCANLRPFLLLKALQLCTVQSLCRRCTIRPLDTNLVHRLSLLSNCNRSNLKALCRL